VDKAHNDKTLIGWREWLALPGLGVDELKVKIDTGARTSALHAFTVEKFVEHGAWCVRFGIHPLHKDNSVEHYCVADLVEERWVMDSGGHREKRAVIYTPICMGGNTWPIYITLTNRDNMTFRMLLGRNALRGRVIVDMNASYLLGRPRPMDRFDSPT
jgi:hypothetical protein